MLSQVGTKKRALEAAESLLGYPDSKVKTTAQVVADYLKGLPLGVDEFLQAVTPEGSIMARMELQQSIILAKGRLYQLRRPVKVTVAREQNYFVAWGNRFLVHGTGDTVEKALRNYMEEWRKHYEILVADEDCLAPPLRKELASIRRLVVKEWNAARPSRH